METLIKFRDFVDEIRKDNSRLYKIGVLNKYADDEDIKKYLNFIYNPYITTGISTKKLEKFTIDTCVDYHNNRKVDTGEHRRILPEDATGCRTVYDIMDYITDHNTGRDCDIIEVKSFKFFYIHPDLWDLYDAVIMKDLQIGVDVLTINKCMNNFIPTFSVQLANKYFEKPDYVEGKRFALTTKIDGGRIIAIKKDGKVDFYTRAGQKYEGLIDLEEEMLNNFPDNICLDGEITLLDKGDLTSKDQYKKTMMITRRDGEKHGVKMLVFDMITADDFIRQESHVSYESRHIALEHLFSNSSLKYFELLPILYIGEDTSEILRILNEQVAKGEEGIMINICDAPYAFKRTSNLLKCKLMKDIDLEVIGYEEGSGANKNSLGAFLVRYKDGNIVKVGSGFSKEYRQEVWRHPDDYLSKVISVQYFEETTNQNGGLSLRFPVFISERTDKNADY